MDSWSDSETGDMAAERIRAERQGRGRAEKVWRTVRWAESFPDEAFSMDQVDLTPTFAIRKIAVLFDRKKFQDCAALVRRLNGITVSAILSEVPVELLHGALPASLPILEALYLKVHHSAERGSLPTGQLMTDQLVKRLVTLFATQSMSHDHHNEHAYIPYCRTIVKIILSVEKNFREIVLQRKRAIDRCLKKMGRHGMVDSSGGKLMTLHDALKVEFEKVVIQYKCALQKLDDLCLTAKHPVTSSVSSGPAPIEGSHQRMMQVTRADVQDRIIKNKTLYNLVEPAVSGQYLKKLIRLLEHRIDYDKVLLFHDTELRKMSEGAVHNESLLSHTLRQFSHGYDVMLRIIADVTGEKFFNDDDDVSSDDDSGILPMTSTLSIMERMKVISLNGIIPLNMTTGSAGRSQQLINLIGEGSTRARGMERHGGFVSGETNGRRRVANGDYDTIQETDSGQVHNGRDHASGPGSNPRNAVLNHDKSLISAPIQVAPVVPDKSVALLEQEVRYLRDELVQSREQIRKLQEQEKQLRERLAGQVYQKFTSRPNLYFEDLSLGTQRPTSLIRSYDDLYREGRVDTLDALDALEELRGLDVLKMKILFSVVVLSFRCVHQALHELKGRLRHLLCLAPEPVEAGSLDEQMEQSIDRYLTLTMDRHDLSNCVHEVGENIYATLYDYPGLRSCAGLAEYTKSTVRLAWALSVQSPAYTISYDAKRFQPQRHLRFHSSDSETEEIKSFLWPELIDSSTGQCVSKGVVIT